MPDLTCISTRQSIKSQNIQYLGKEVKWVYFEGVRKLSVFFRLRAITAKIPSFWNLTKHVHAERIYRNKGGNHFYVSFKKLSSCYVNFSIFKKSALLNSGSDSQVQRNEGWNISECKNFKAFKNQRIKNYHDFHGNPWTLQPRIALQKSSKRSSKNYNLNWRKGIEIPKISKY